MEELKEGVTALYMACSYGYTECARALIARGADTSIKVGSLVSGWEEEGHLPKWCLLVYS
jgi:ankyrin repeat protein